MQTVLILGLGLSFGRFELETGFMLSGVIFPSDTFHYYVGLNDIEKNLQGLAKLIG